MSDAPKIGHETTQVKGETCQEKVEEDELEVVVLEEGGDLKHKFEVSMQNQNSLGS